MTTLNQSAQPRALRLARALWPTLAVAAAAGALFVAILLAARAVGWPTMLVVTDMAAIGRMSPFTSLLSNLGVLMMAGTAAICLFAARFVRGDGGLLLAAGVFTTVVFADDFLMLHTNVLPQALGLPDLAIYAAYGGGAAALAWRFRRRLSGTADLPLALGAAFLAMSVAIDLVGPPIRRVILAEEGAKFVGYAVWCGYWIARAGRAVGAPAGR